MLVVLQVFSHTNTTAAPQIIDQTPTEPITKEDIPMTKTMKIEGMMCPHCEAHVKKALEALDGVSEAVADFKAGTAVVTMTADVADDILTAAVEEADYTVLGIE